MSFAKTKKPLYNPYDLDDWKSFKFPRKSRTYNVGWNNSDNVFDECDLDITSFMKSEKWKVSVFGVIMVRIQSECGKMWTRITSNMDTFYAVQDFKLHSKLQIRRCNMDTFHETN